MTADFVKELVHNFAEALRANPGAARDVQELLGDLGLTHADLVSADVPDVDLCELVDIALPYK